MNYELIVFYKMFGWQSKQLSLMITEVNFIEKDWWSTSGCVAFTLGANRKLL